MPQQDPQFNGSEIKEPSPKVQKLDQNGVHGTLEPAATLFLKVKKLSEKAVLPSRASPISAGYDLSSATDIKVPARGKALVPTDLSIAIPEGTYACIAPRSGLAWKHSIDVGAGVIDADYRGPVGVILFNHSDVDFEVKVGDRIAQLIIIMTPDVEEVDDLDSTDRGAAESDLPSGESASHRGRDYTPEFTTDQVFKGRDEMLDWVRRVGQQNGIVVVIKKSANLKGGKLPKCILGCERGGKYEPSRHLLKGQPLQRNTKTRKCGCPFELRGLPIPPDGVMWGLLVKCGFHNHETAEYFDGHEYSSRLKPVEKQFVLEMADSTKPREILSVLKERDPSNTTGIQSIYNAIYKHKEVKRGGGK